MREVRWFVPIEEELRGSKPRGVEWYVLIREMEAFRKRTGWGLARSWGYVHRGDYEGARRSFDEAVQNCG